MPTAPLSSNSGSYGEQELFAGFFPAEMASGHRSLPTRMSTKYSRRIQIHELYVQYFSEYYIQTNIKLFPPLPRCRKRGVSSWFASWFSPDQPTQQHHIMDTVENVYFER